MKKIITSIVFLFFILNSFGQKLNAVFVQDTIVVERDKTIMQMVPIPINIMSLNPTGVVGAIPNVLNFATVPLAVNALPAVDFQFTAGALPPINAGTTQVAWQVTILPGTNAADNALFISVQITYNDGAAQTKSVIIKVINKKPVEKEDNDDVDVSLLVGSNLDFFNSVKLKDLAGEFNIFLPEIFSFKSNNKKIKIGASLGIYNYRNFSVDSPGTVTSYNYKLVPFETLDPTKKIVKATFSSSGKSTKDFQGFYVEPLLLLREDKKTHLFLSFHLEVLKRTEKIEYDNPNYIWRDTVLYNPARDNVINEHGDIIRRNPSNTYHSAYYGIGFPVSLSKKYFELYFAPTVGISKYNVTSYQTKAGGTFTINETGPFYLCKFFFKEKLSLLGLTIGGEVRGIFGKLNPYLNAYVATRISLSKFSDFFKASSK